jgi:putative oxidoreductase
MPRVLDAVAARAEPFAYAALRIVSGGFFAVHGAQKLFGWHGGSPGPAIGSQIWIGALLELVTGALIAFGWGTRPAALLASGEMAVAYFQFHWKLKMVDAAWIPVFNHGELAALYCFLFLFIAARGGAWKR